MECKNCNFWNGKECTDDEMYIDKNNPSDLMCQYNPSAILLDGYREMLGDDTSYFDNAGIDDIGCK